jgi:hypothetical protein
MSDKAVKTKQVNRRLSFEEDSSSEDESFSGSTGSIISSEDESGSIEISDSESESEVSEPKKKQTKPSTPIKKSVEIPKKAVPPAPKKAKPDPVKKPATTTPPSPSKLVKKKAEPVKKPVPEEKKSKQKKVATEKEKKEKKLEIDEVTALLKGYKINRSRDVIKAMKKHNKDLFLKVCKILSTEATYSFTDRSPTGRLFIFSRDKLQIHSEAKETASSVAPDDYKFRSLADFPNVVTLSAYASKKSMDLKTIQAELSEKKTEKLNEELSEIKEEERKESHILYALIKKKIIECTPALYSTSVGATVVCWLQEKQAFWLNSEECKQRLGPVVLVSTAKITAKNVPNEESRLRTQRTELLSILKKAETKETDKQPSVLPQKKRKLKNVPTEEEEELFEKERMKKKAKTAPKEPEPDATKTNSAVKMDVEKKKKKKAPTAEVALIGISSKADKAEVKRKVKELKESEGPSQASYSAQIQTSLAPDIVLAALQNGGIEALEKRIKEEELLLKKTSDLSNKSISWFREHCK